MRTIWNLLRAGVILAIASLIGYYSYDKFGWLSVVTNVAFMTIGFLLVGTWATRNNRYEATSDEPCSNVTVTSVDVAEDPVVIDREETDTERFTVESRTTNSVN